jgi:hypothetical protein
VTTRSLAIQKWSCGRRLHPSPPKLCKQNHTTISTPPLFRPPRSRLPNRSLAVGSNPR